MSRHSASGDKTRLAPGFLRRWSERKLERGEQEADRGPPAPEEISPDDQNVAAEPELPPLDTLGEDSNYADFLSPKVNEELRRLALRQLFRSAKFNVRDGLDDYDEDFTSFSALGDTITADMRHRWEMERQQREAIQEPARAVENQELVEPTGQTSKHAQTEHPDDSVPPDDNQSPDDPEPDNEPDPNIEKV